MPLSRRQKLIMAVGGALFGNNAAARQSKVILKHIWVFETMVILFRVFVWMVHVTYLPRLWWNSEQGR